MGRKNKSVKREVKVDPRYNSRLAGRFINYVMRRGKRSNAVRILVEALDIIEKGTSEDPFKVLKDALNNVKPSVQVKSRRVGGATYQVPVEVPAGRRTTLAMRWLILYSKTRSDHSMGERLAKELMDAAKGQGGAVGKKLDTHRMAEANRAFAHYRW